MAGDGGKSDVCKIKPENMTEIRKSERKENKGLFKFKRQSSPKILAQVTRWLVCPLKEKQSKSPLPLLVTTSASQSVNILMESLLMITIRENPYTWK